MNRNRYLIGALLVCSTTRAQIDRSVQPQAGPEPEINFGTPQEYQFSNGLTLMVVENHKLPQVSVSLRIDSRFTQKEKGRHQWVTYTNDGKRQHKCVKRCV